MNPLHMRKLIIFSALILVVLSLSNCGLFEHKKEDPGPPPLFKAASTDLVSTSITSHTLAPLDPDTNQVYCGTFALAWNTMIDSVIGEPIMLSGPASTQSIVEVLNSRLFHAEYLDPASYVALAGFRRDSIEVKIQEALYQTFGGEAPDVIFQPGFPEEVISYAYLLKRLDFNHVFTTLDRPLRFNGDENQKVHAFGVDRDQKGSRAADILSQVIVKGTTDRGYIVEIDTKSERDHLILAMLDPGETLQETWERAVEADLESEDYTLSPGVDFKVPKINFDLEHQYEELLLGYLLNEGWEVYYVKEARQNIRFQLSERGAVLESSATITGAPSAPPEVIAFDRPFLLALIEEGAEQPYFLLWIANAELLARVR